jgi:hypothetical protein
MHVLSLHITVEGMFLLPNSEHVPIKLKLLLIRAETLDKPLTAKCFIHVVCALHEQCAPAAKL